MDGDQYADCISCGRVMVGIPIAAVDLRDTCYECENAPAVQVGVKQEKRRTKKKNRKVKKDS